FSSRRRHTRWPRDWSSDVCSSDLRGSPAARVCRRGGSRVVVPRRVRSPWIPLDDIREQLATHVLELAGSARSAATEEHRDAALRSEERRVGKGGGVRRGASHDTKG